MIFTKKEVDDFLKAFDIQIKKTDAGWGIFKLEGKSLWYDGYKTFEDALKFLINID